MKQLTLLLASFFFITQVNARPFDYQIPRNEEVLLRFGKNIGQTLNPKEIKLLVWNIYKGEKATFKTWFPVLNQDRDITVIQEMLVSPTLKLMMNLFLKDHVMATSFINEENHRTGVMTSSAVDAKMINFQVSEKTEPIVNTPKVALLTTYPIRKTNKQLLVVNIHAINFVDNKWFDKQINNLFMAIDRHINSGSGPVIFAGDFNTWNKNRYYTLDRHCRIRGLRQVSFSPDLRMTFNGNPLDHVIYSPDLQLIESKVMGNVDGSDHKPMIVSFKYVGETENQEE